MEMENTYSLDKWKGQMSCWDAGEPLWFLVTLPAEHRVSDLDRQQCPGREGNGRSKTMLDDLKSGLRPRPWPNIL